MPQVATRPFFAERKLLSFLCFGHPFWQTSCTDGPLIWVRLFVGVAHHKGPGNGAIFRVNSRPTAANHETCNAMQTIFNLACWHHLEPSCSILKRCEMQTGPCPVLSHAKGFENCLAGSDARLIAPDVAYRTYRFNLCEPGEYGDSV